MPHSRCVPVVFNQELARKKRHVMPKRKMTPFPIPWYIMGLRIILPITANVSFFVSLFSHESKAKMQPGTQAVMFFLHIITIFFDFFMLIIEGNEKREAETLDDCPTPNRPYKIILVIKSVWSISIITATYLFASFFIIYSAAMISSIVIEATLCILWDRHNLYQKTKHEKLLISDIEANVGLDNCVNIPIVTEFREYDVSEDKIWEGFPIASRDTTIKPSCAIMKVTRGWMYFVSWASYSVVNNRIKEDSAIIEDLTKRNKELRRDVLRQNDRIYQIRTKIDGPYPNCADINEVPLCPPPVELWNAEQASGLFVYLSGNVKAFVNMRDFRKLAVHAALVRKSVQPLRVERRQLTEGLEMRRLLIEELVVDLLNYINEEEGSRKSDVQIQMTE